MNALKTAIVQAEMDMLLKQWNRSSVLPKCIGIVTLLEDDDGQDDKGVSSFITIREMDTMVAAHSLAGLIQELVLKIAEIRNGTESVEEPK